MHKSWNRHVLWVSKVVLLPFSFGNHNFLEMQMQITGKECHALTLNVIDYKECLSNGMRENDLPFNMMCNYQNSIQHCWPNWLEEWNILVSVNTSMYLFTWTSYPFVVDLLDLDHLSFGLGPLNTSMRLVVDLLDHLSFFWYLAMVVTKLNLLTNPFLREKEKISYVCKL